MSYKAERIYDVRLVWTALFNPIIWDSVSEDGAELYEPDIIGDYWVGIFYNDVYIGAYRIHQITGPCWQIHAFILPEFRKKHSVDSGMTILRWINDNVELQKLIAIIPEKYANVYEFTKKQGFKDEGFNRDSWLKDSKIYGQHLLGITKAELTAVIGET